MLESLFLSLHLYLQEKTRKNVLCETRPKIHGRNLKHTEYNDRFSMTV